MKKRRQTRIMPIVKRKIKKIRKDEILATPLTKRKLISHLATRFKIPQNTITSIFDEVAALTIKKIKNTRFSYLPGIGKIRLLRSHRSGRNTKGEFVSGTTTRLRMQFKNAFVKTIISKKN